jgi:Uma2 family endonuclease
VSVALPKLAVARDLVALGDARVEIVHGVIEHKAEPSAEHGDAQLGLGSFLRQHFHRRAGDGGAGGWWILTEVEVALATHEVYRPDISGWRRGRVPERPRGRPVRERPDFICEVLSESNATTDQVDKFRVYAANGVPFYWIADPVRQILTVYRVAGALYTVIVQAKAGESVRAPPFEAVALRVGLLFGEDPE